MPKDLDIFNNCRNKKFVSDEFDWFGVVINDQFGSSADVLRINEFMYLYFSWK